MQKGFKHQFHQYVSDFGWFLFRWREQNGYCSCFAGTGSKYETKDINGISHFLEHMMFKGTTKRPGKMDIARELDSIGAEYNAFTARNIPDITQRQVWKIDTILMWCLISS